MSMNKNGSKHDHLWDKEDFKKNVHPYTIMHQSEIIDETQEIARKSNVYVQ